jgi:peptide/nickel transport system substrate-binding protein
MGRRFLAIGAATALAVAACSGGGEDVSVDEDEGGGGSGGTFVAAISAQPDQLDPHQTTAYASFQVLENVYDTLVEPDPDNVGEFLPSLASEWETSDDGLTWTFTLRDDVTFQDGSEFDSADVVYTFNRIIDDELSNAYKFADVEEITAPDATTVEFTLGQPSPHLLDDVGNYKGTAILAENSADDIDLKTEANGTGPFSLRSSGADGITLEKFDD